MGVLKAYGELMVMDVDERRCPSCGHDVLNWDVACPGCDQVPWDSPTGRRIIRQRRRQHTLFTTGPIAAFLILIVTLVIVGNWHSTKATQWSRQEGDLAHVIDRAQWLSGMLGQAKPGTPDHEQLLASGRQWLNRELPTLLAAAQDSRLPQKIRLEAVMGLAVLVEESGGLASLLKERREDIVASLMPLVSEQDRFLRKSAVAVLLALGAGDELRRQHPDVLPVEGTRRDH